MLLKLLKYDFRAMWKSFSLIWGAALALSLVHGVVYSLRPMPFYSSGVTVMSIVSAVLSITLTAMFVIVLVFIIRRFEKGLLGDEGYLMHTLPVRPWQLVLSKLICALAVIIISVAVSFLVLILMIPVDWYEILYLPYLWDFLRWTLSHPDLLAYLAELCLVVLSCLVLGISILYLSMAIGHLFHRRRTLMGVAAFIGLYILINIYSAWVADIAIFRMESHAGLLASAAVVLLPAAVCLAAVCWILEHRLDLE